MIDTVSMIASMTLRKLSDTPLVRVLIESRMAAIILKQNEAATATWTPMRRSTRRNGSQKLIFSVIICLNVASGAKKTPPIRVKNPLTDQPVFPSEVLPSTLLVSINSPDQNADRNYCGSGLIKLCPSFSMGSEFLQTRTGV